MSCCVSTRACHCGCFGFKLPHPEKAIRFMFCKTADHQEAQGASSAKSTLTVGPACWKQRRNSLQRSEAAKCRDQSRLRSEKVVQNKDCTGCNKVREALLHTAWHARESSIRGIPEIWVLSVLSLPLTHILCDMPCPWQK